MENTTGDLTPERPNRLRIPCGFGETPPMIQRQTGPIQVTVGDARLLVDTRLPDVLASVEAKARFADRSWSEDDVDGTLFVAIAKGNGSWDFVSTLRYGPAGYGFVPGVLLVPETKTLFIGAGATLLCYSVGAEPSRLWADETDMGFWSWRGFGGLVLMAAELELAAWTTHGEKLWSTFVEPPWTYEVAGGSVELDVMGTQCSFDIATGPRWTRLPWL